MRKFVGYCDFGSELQIEGPGTAATEALVLMLVSLKGKWKIPVGYVFQNKVNAVSQAELVKSSLILSHKSGLCVWVVTCDGAFTYFSTFKILGCNLSIFIDSKPWFKHPANGSQVFFIPDTLGNTLAIESSNALIKWCHFEYLHQL